MCCKYLPKQRANMSPKRYKDSDDAEFKRMVRTSIRKSEMTKSDRDITIALVNLWFYHKGGAKKYIHPGRKHLAKKAGVTVKTVSRCLARLRTAQIISPIKNPRGEGQKPTQYTVNIHNLLVFCGGSWIDEYMRLSYIKCPTTLLQNVPPLAGQNVPQYNNTLNMSFYKKPPHEKMKRGDE